MSDIKMNVFEAIIDAANKAVETATPEQKPRTMLTRDLMKVVGDFLNDHSYANEAMAEMLKDGDTKHDPMKDKVIPALSAVAWAAGFAIAAASSGPMRQLREPIIKLVADHMGKTSQALSRGFELSIADGLGIGMESAEMRDANAFGTLVDSFTNMTKH